MLTRLRLNTLMATHGTIYPLTVDHTSPQVPVYFMNHNAVRIQGSLVGGREDIKQLLEFASRHKIRPTIMKFPLTAEGMEDAMEKLNTGKIRYRAVLSN
jgi:D-arabinose 1-dehydrogenase-like Zn-dependent alcohol dehydrogenase